MALPDEPIAFDATIVRAAGDAPTEARPARPLGEELRGDLRIVRLLGEGGMGQVHLAEQRSLAREVAVKTVHADGPESAAAALCEEALITGQIDHPSVIPVHALGRSADGRPMMVMKRVEGVSWSELLASPEHPMWETISGRHGLVAHLEILVKVCHALEYAHSRGIVHRDLKPENVMLGRFGEVYLVDWGLGVRVAEQRAGDEPAPIVGTPAYMAPEMVAGQPADERTDVYLLGAILHELLTGEPPHAGGSLVAVLAEAYESAPKAYDASVPDELASLCRDAMSQDPAARPGTARVFRDRLVGHLQHRASTTISRRGHERLESQAGRDLASPEDRAAIRRALIECRFAFMQALDEWSENESARRGLRLCEERAVEVELADENAAAARIALEAIDDPPPELVRALERLEARQARAREEAEQLRRLARDHDVRIGGSVRRRAAWWIAGLCAVVSLAVVQWREQVGLGPWDLVRVASFMSASMLALFVIFRRRLLRNAFSRKVAYLGLFGTLSMLGHRVLGALADQPVHVVLATDSLLFTVFLVTAAITLAPWLGIGAVFTFAGALASLVQPERAPMWFSVSTVLMVIVAAIFFRPEADESEE